MQSEPSRGIKLIAYSCICWLFHRIYYDARNHKHKMVLIPSPSFLCPNNRNKCLFFYLHLTQQYTSEENLNNLKYFLIPTEKTHRFNERAQRKMLVLFSVLHVRQRLVFFITSSGRTVINPVTQILCLCDIRRSRDTSVCSLSKNRRYT